MEEMKIAVLGLGTVGQGVVELLEKNRTVLAANAGCSITLGRALEKFITKKMDISLPAEVCTSRWEDILHDPEIAVVVETIGGIEPARTYILQALQAGKNVVTANKDLLAVCGQELFRVAREARCDLYYEACVGGGIPIVGTLRQSLVSARLDQVMGIVNGTTNYILTKMEEEGRAFEEILQDVQDMGIAEADPGADIEGLDAARKVAILATLAFHTQVTLPDVYVEGISKITGEDVRLAKALGYRIKLLALCRSNGREVEARVHPALLPLDHPLAAVRDTYNAIFVSGPELGETMFYGVGTGRFPSAGAVLCDVAAIARNMRDGCQGCLNTVESRDMPIKAMQDVVTKFFLRLVVTDQPGVLAQVTEVLGDCGVSLARVIQTNLGATAEVVFVTHAVADGKMQQAVGRLGRLAVTREIVTLLRVAE